MLFDFLADLFKAFFYTAAVLILLLCLPFVVVHVVDHWNAPEYPYVGFTPDCPTWEAPSDAPAELWRGKLADDVENSLPPTYSLAVGE